MGYIGGLLNIRLLIGSLIFSPISEFIMKLNLIEKLFCLEELNMIN